jgi:biotin-dependent carboxylase-like uncharacterized protein
VVRPSLVVERTGPLALVQDAGRPGLSAVGVGPSGACDRAAFELGARLLGQDGHSAAIECLLGGLALRVSGTAVLVSTGAPVDVALDGRLVGHAAPFTATDGQQVVLGRPRSGLRTYLSVRGGVDVPAVLGSRSRDTLAGLGPPPLAPGDVLALGEPRGQVTVDVAPVPPPVDGTVDLPALRGPRWDRLEDPGGVPAIRWRVGSASDRVGLRLEGPPLARHGDELEAPSEGLVRGAVQVPADGLPVVFLSDHPVTGGYPVVAVLTARGADLAAQVVPGQEVRLRVAAAGARRSLR